ncbi:glycoside hydrolase family 28 protein [Paenibacillus thalictri]|uniref:Glycoside hydrolase family 28 protein n=1 Tax=Paenibacillus thalictri TaxID=2527873 RepID=A0A4Q9DNX3_9BACL|nr:glycoside hydrolase family 28 protein [Paenibacillus thalictri]TBL75302.1 glycoside hydrolase family 28 protein [Paenibacillus thalictri]
MAVFHITDFGAVGDGAADNTHAIASAIEACEQAGGGTVYVPAGNYITGPIVLKSRMTLYVEAGATLRFHTRFDGYPAVPTRWSGYECYGYSPLIYGKDIQKVAIKGEGIIEGQGEAWWEAYREIRRGGSAPESSVRHELMVLNQALAESVKSNIVEWDSQFLRPPLLQLIGCEQVVLEGVTLQNSPFWNTHLVYCDHVNVRGVTFKNPSTTPNGDGFDVDSCSNVRISDCHFDVGDDCLCLKAGIDEDGRRVGRPTENVAVTNCTMLHGHGGVVMGSETSGGIRRVVISNCIFIGTDRGIRVKTNRQRGGGVEDIRINNIFMQDVLCPLAINGFYKHGVDESNPMMTTSEAVPVWEGTPVIKNIYISDILAKNCLASAGFIYGLPEAPIENVVLRHMTLETTLDPEEKGGEPDMVREERVMAGEGMLCKHVKGLELHQVTIETRQGPALLLENVSDADVDGLRMRTRHPATPVIRVKETQRLRLPVNGESAEAGYAVYV